MNTSATSLRYFRVDIPEGSSGDWTVARYVQDPRDPSTDENADPRPHWLRYRPGTYTCLRCGTVDFMTDLYDEWWTQRDAMLEARRRGGRALVTGLGLGMVAQAMLDDPEGERVERVTVVEASADVIRLVAPTLRERYGERLEIVHGDAFTWRPPPGERFEIGWHDIWPDPYEERTIPEMKALAEHYDDVCAWQGFWPRSYLDCLEAETLETETGGET